MARKVKDIVIQTDDPENRDNGKVFRIKEMPAVRAEKWAARAFLATTRGGDEVPDEIARQGIVGLVYVFMNKLTGVEWSDLDPLLDEMLTCVRVVPDPSNPQVERTADFEGDIEEITTLVRLRKEVLELHAGFTFADTLSRLRAATSATRDSPTTGTSPAS